jgi:hypothetical protein
LFIALLARLISGGRQDGLYIAARNIKYKIFYRNHSYNNGSATSEIFLYKKRQNEFEFNNYNQLIFKFDQIETNRPEITPNTMIAFVFGQSNSANHGGEKYFLENNNVLNYFNKKFYLASDPLFGATGISDNVWVNLGNKIIENKIADKVILIPARIGALQLSYGLKMVTLMTC